MSKTINTEFSFTDSMIIYINRSNTYSTPDIKFFKFIDVVETYNNNIDKLNFYTSILTGFKKKVTPAQLTDIFKHGRLYHFYIPDQYIENWIFEVLYFNFYTTQLRLLFDLKYPDIGVDKFNIPYFYDPLFSEFQSAYKTFIQSENHQ
jgi:hypothetical protein